MAYALPPGRFAPMTYATGTVPGSVTTGDSTATARPTSRWRAFNIKFVSILLSFGTSCTSRSLSREARQIL